MKVPDARISIEKCSGLNASALKVMDLKGGRNMKYYCGDCQMVIKLIPKLRAPIDIKIKSIYLQPRGLKKASLIK